MPLKISVSGVRGVVGTDLTPPIIVSFISSFLRTLRKTSGTILIGRDARKSGIMIQHMVEGTANALGWNCIRIGIAPTPTVLLATRKLGCDGGIVITASHNPVQWNALKFCDGEGLFLRAPQVHKIEKMLGYEGTIPWKDFRNIGDTTFREDIARLHIEEVLRNIDVDRIRRRKLKVVVDPCGSAGSSIDRRFLETLGCTVFGINEQITDHFPREPEPIPQNLTQLGKEVLERKAHIGFAQDPDADRLAVVSEQGIPIGEEYTLVLAGESYLRRRKTDIAVNLSTSMMIDDLAARYESMVYRTKIGEINVTDALLRKGLDFGGEGNGGAIVPRINPCRDSIVAMGLILELISLETRNLTQILLDFPSYCMKKDKFVIKNIKSDDFYTQLLSESRECFKDYSFNTEDGIKMYTREEWLHIRSSNTEPAVRIIAESGNVKRTDELLGIGRKLVQSL
jgi:phosphomannomutase